MRRSGLLVAPLALAAILVAAGCGSSTTSPSDVANAAAATSCDLSGYQIVSNITGKKEPIYDCTFPDGSVKCVTYANGVANDSTAIVRILFQNKLGAGKPSCLGS